MLHPVMRRRIFGLLGGFLALLVVSTDARAAFPQAEESVRRLVDDLAALLANRQPGEQLDTAALEGVLGQEADLALLGRLSLGRHWRAATPEQQAEYGELFKTMMLRRFAGYLNAYSGDQLALGDLLEIQGSREVARGDVLVDTRIDPPDRPPIQATWRLRERDGAYRVIDLIVEEVSLLITQRAEFSSIIERSGIDGLLAQLRRQQGTDS